MTIGEIGKEVAGLPDYKNAQSLCSRAPIQHWNGAREMSTEDVEKRRLCRWDNLSAMDAYLLCSVCVDFVINELVNKPVHVVSLYFPRLVLE